jgi:ketosteroid isomerase-like protein
MSEEENLSIVKRLEAEDFISQTSRQTVMNGLAEDVEWWVAGPPDLLPWAGTFRGHEEVSRCLRASLENLKYEKWDFIDWITKGDDVIEFVHARGYAKATGVRYESDIVRVWTLREGKVARVRTFYDTLTYAKALYGERFAVTGKK